MDSSLSFILFGVTGDLARQKLIPALYKLYVRGLLPQGYSLTGYGRKTFSLKDFRTEIEYLIRDIRLPSDISSKKNKFINEFIERCFYVQGQLDHGADFEKLKAHIDSLQTNKKIFYLSIPPSYHCTVVHQLGWIGLLQENASVMIEKPFGEDEKTAKELNLTLRKYVSEESIYRIDHYLGKEALLNFSEEKKSSLFSYFWNDTYIESIDVMLYEQKTITGRGAFYDQIGALRDVGQNHVLQMLASVISLPKGSMSATDLSKEKTKILSAIEIHPKELIRGQYKGYLREGGVKGNSETETFFKAGITINLPQWKKTKITLATGKALKETKSDILITFRNFTNGRNKVQKSSTYTISLNVPSTQPFQYPDAYEYVFLSAMKGDKTIFICLQEAIAGWRFVKKLHQLWKAKKVPLLVYKQGVKAELIKE